MSLQPAPATDSPTLLVIDDEDALRMAMLRWFSRRGWRCVEAATLADAERLLFSPGAIPPDAILCDLHLPDGSGNDLIERMTRERPALTARLILATGEMLGEDQLVRLEAIGCRTLCKPFDLMQAEQAITAARGRRHMRAAS